MVFIQKNFGPELLSWDIGYDLNVTQTFVKPETQKHILYKTFNENRY